MIVARTGQQAPGEHVQGRPDNKPAFFGVIWPLRHSRDRGRRRKDAAISKPLRPSPASGHAVAAARCSSTMFNSRVRSNAASEEAALLINMIGQVRSVRDV